MLAISALQAVHLTPCLVHCCLDTQAGQPLGAGHLRGTLTAHALMPLTTLVLFPSMLRAGLVSLWVQDIRDTRDRNVEALRQLPPGRAQADRLVEMNVLRQVGPRRRLVCWLGFYIRGRLCQLLWLLGGAPDASILVPVRRAGQQNTLCGAPGG